ncbi:helix-turn-helix transcriptional regulator [Saccharopolyspora gloriosae]|uniref:helix-turn-helix domain-containing protein n=1 Tax=Saccharopolyspora gloriosae TaxID=455344 RepID=UPI001FB62491|nr:helix-turn-helix transcriptional regulator [Saccharopolyspora gloriosae]
MEESSRTLSVDDELVETEEFAVERVSPTVRLRKVVRRLLAWREAAGMRQDDVASALRWSKAKISRFENADQIPGPADVLALAAIYGVNDAERDQYVALSLQARQRGWWQSYGDSLANNFGEYVGLEAEAKHVREFAIDLIPGLLQTEAYAGALVEAWVPQVEESVARDRANLRRERQKNLIGDDPVSVSAVIGEAALRQFVGGAQVMREQLDHLAEVSKLSNVDIQVLPFAAGGVPAMGSPFIILSFAEPDDPDVAFSEHLTGCVYVEDVDELASYNLNFGALQDKALAPEASIEFITSLAGDLRAR